MDLNWRKSTVSDNGNCVELAEDGDQVALRDSKHPNGPVHHFTRAEMSAFIAGVKRGEFDDLT